MQPLEEPDIVQMVVGGVVALSWRKVKVPGNLVHLELTRDATALGGMISDFPWPVLAHALLDVLHAGRGQTAGLVGGKDGRAAVAAYLLPVGSLRVSIVAAAAVVGGAAEGRLAELAERLAVGAEPDLCNVLTHVVFVLICSVHDVEGEGYGGVND